MPVKAPKIHVSAPTGVIPSGRGFYQLEEEELYLAVEYPGERPSFFSYLESDTLSFHLDREGRLIFIELLLPRRRWLVKENLIIPERAESADLRFLDFRSPFERPVVFCDRTRQNLMIRFSRGPAVNNYFLAQNLIAQLNTSYRLVALWVSDIVDDVAGREIYSWRKEVHGEPVAWPPHLARSIKM
ncbi:MAG: hypothetical protein CVT49_02380 [candidate division Zixibacteria bacterium HGW-Zixibacteria-1]|nr:MAG: hypothetical protein CVT49_02380 [candidate division Zixibacteria bacterium HGW-Zixibacteria-1]